MKTNINEARIQARIALELLKTLKENVAKGQPILTPAAICCDIQTIQIWLEAAIDFIGAGGTK